MLAHQPASCRAERSAVLGAIALDAWQLEFASAKLQDDAAVVLAAVAQDGEILQLASLRLRASKEVVLAAVSSDASALRYASSALREDATVVMAAIRTGSPWVLAMVPEPAKTRSVVIAAVKRNGLALEHAPTALRGDAEVVAVAVGQDPRASRFARSGAIDMIPARNASSPLPLSVRKALDRSDHPDLVEAASADRIDQAAALPDPERLARVKRMLGQYPTT